MKIIFFGTPEIAAEQLKAIIEAGYDVSAVVTVPDKPMNRGLKLKPSPVKVLAQEKKIPVLQPEKLKDSGFINELKSFSADLFVVVAFRKLPREVWELPAKGTVNLHASYLPQYRGAAPINWAIINGEKQTGVSTFFINDKIDTGDIILRKKIPIDFEDTATILYNKIVREGKNVLLDTLKMIKSDKIKLIPQNKLKIDGTLKIAPKITKEMCKIDWNRTAEEVYNFIRGLSEKPTAWTVIKSKDKQLRLKIYFANFEVLAHNHTPGTIIRSGKYFKIAVADGYILPTDLQLEGKKRLNTENFLNGFNIEQWSVL